MPINDTTLSGSITHTSGGSITHTAGGSITHTAVTQISHSAAQIAHSALAKLTHSAPIINSSASAVMNIGGPVSNYGGIMKLFLAKLAAVSSPISSFMNLSTTLSSVTSAFSSVTGLGGLVSQISSISSSFSSLTSLASSFGSISSLSGALSSFQSLTGGLNSLTGGSTKSGGGSSGGNSGSLNTLTNSSNQALGGVGNLSQASDHLSALASTASFSSVSTNLTNLANFTGALNPAVGLSQNNQNMTSVANAVVSLQNMGIQQSQPGSTTTIAALKALMQDIFNLLTTLMAPATVTIGGSITAGDAIALTIANASLIGSPKTYIYTVASGNTVNNVASGLRALLAADSALTTAGITSSVSGAVITINSTSPTAYVTTVGGSQTETANIGGGDVTQALSNSVLLDHFMTGSLSDLSAATAAFAGLP